MKKSTAWVVIAIIIIALGWWAMKNKSGQLSSSLKIGVILPLTGDVASLGENARNGATLAKNNLDSKIQEKISLFFEDDRFDPKESVSAFNKLIDVDKVDAIVCFTSAPCSALAPLADQKQIPLIAVASAPVQKDKNFVVRLEISTSEEARRLAEFLQEKNYQHIASVIAIQDGIQAGYQTLSEDSFFSSHQVASETVQPDLKEFRTPLTKLLASKPDVILVGLLPGVAGEFGKEARALGYKGDFIGFNFIEGDETLTAAQGKLNGIVYTQVSDPQDWFAQKYQEAYKKSMGPGSAHLYDAVTLLSKAVEEKKTTNSDLINFLTSIKEFSGALGTYSSIEGHEYSLPIVLKTIKDSKFVPYQQ